MSALKKATEKFIRDDVPMIKPGFTVKVHQKIREGEKERVQIFEGLVIKVSSGSETNKTFTVRKVFQGIGVEKIFPINSPNIAKIEVTKSSKVRRAKLYFIRNLTGKAARLKEKILSAKDLQAMSDSQKSRSAKKSESKSATKADQVETEVVAIESQE
jgi:large subunit ribosomal protein L19